MSEQPIIRIKGLDKTYSPGTDREVHALSGIDLTINEGDIFGIIGLSGAGKSTLVRCMNFLEKPTAGTVEVNGQTIMFECEVPSAEFIEFDGEKAVVIDRHGNEKPVWFSGELTVPKGNFKAKLTGSSLNRLIPGAMLTFGFKGKTIK